MFDGDVCGDRSGAWDDPRGDLVVGVYVKGDWGLDKRGEGRTTGTETEAEVESELEAEVEGEAEEDIDEDEDGETTDAAGLCPSTLGAGVSFVRIRACTCACASSTSASCVRTSNPCPTRLSPPKTACTSAS